ncbi:MAG: hypothetical protein H5U19_01315 [Rhodobacteraceae bacterium]|jgi:2-(1,2-epoxy-1,2-dihydrophenyl)acetyl-CoA isomerase|nr:hypothetical protein [Paracoccaceae bacterium]
MAQDAETVQATLAGGVLELVLERPDRLDADTAAHWGLIWKAVEDAALMDEARALAAKFAVGPTRSLGLTRRCIQAAATNSLDAQLDLERDSQRKTGRTADYAEGVTALLEKRAPVFKGK